MTLTSWRGLINYCHQEDITWKTGRRIVDLFHISKELKNGCVTCQSNQCTYRKNWKTVVWHARAINAHIKRTEKRLCDMPEQSMHLHNIERETRRGFGSLLKVRCTDCNTSTTITTRRRHLQEAKDRKQPYPVFDINTKAALGEWNVVKILYWQNVIVLELIWSKSRWCQLAWNKKKAYMTQNQKNLFYWRRR